MILMFYDCKAWFYSCVLWEVVPSSFDIRSNNKTRLTPQRFIEVSVASRKVSGQVFVCQFLGIVHSWFAPSVFSNIYLRVSILPLFLGLFD
jgi:hypothetical protein